MFGFRKKIFKKNRNGSLTGGDANPSVWFQLKYLKLSDTGKARKPRKARVGFSKDGQSIIINNEEKPYNAAYLTNEGMSRDYSYRKFSTPDYIFWIRPEDYDQFVECAGANNHSKA